jgi:hypothetical protein
MKIIYYTDDQLYAGINMLVGLGLGFVADHDSLNITLTGVTHVQHEQD